jgi:alkylhydroperoxidase family enzyme
VTSRLAPIPYDDWDFESLAEISPGMKPPPLNVVAFFAHHPDLARKFLSWNRYVNGSSSTLPRRARELAILRVAWRKRAKYEWAQHLKIARRAGVTDDEIAQLRGAASPAVPATGLTGLMIAAVDELADGAALSDETYQALASELDERQLLDLVFLVGTYALLSMAFNAFRLDLDPGLTAEHFDTGDFDTGDFDTGDSRQQPPQKGT